jgi:hypothetical protein
MGIDAAMMLKKIQKVAMQRWSHCRLKERHIASWERSCKAAWHGGAEVVEVVDYKRRIQGSGWRGSRYRLAAVASMVHLWKLAMNTNLVSRS